MRNSRLIGRIIALAAVTVAAAAIVILLVGSGGSDHTYRAVFQNASQLVKGNLVQVSGTPVGKISSIALTPDGQAEITFKVNGPFVPLHQGTQAVIRQASLSGIANRYIDLQLPADSAPQLQDNAVIDTAHTASAVDLDQLFNVFGPKERKALSSLIQGFGRTYAGEAANANAGFLYLSPTLASSTRLFSELGRDKSVLNRFISTNARFVTDVAAKQDQLAGLVDNLANTTTAIGRQKTALADAVANLPPFMRRANST
ncbi:MAG TPA: MlaD family protein, partial [Solirubrobacteraceae bacterium]|nr:MlaD family protein [Solirubrobacteraceae bacterium]